MTTKEDFKKAQEFWEAAGYDISNCTCITCINIDNCLYALDLYNTDDDCLANK